MAEQFQTSFIPKKTFDVGPAPKATGSSVSAILSFVAVIALVLSIVSAAGVFLYERFLITSIKNKEETLERAKSAFEPELIRELSRIDAKFMIGERLLDEHTAPSGLLNLLEDVTLETVRFTTFSYLSDPEGLHLSMQGEARSFASVALQSDEFGRNRSLRDTAFSGLTLDERGNVQFTVSAIVDPALVSYRERAAQGGNAFFEVEPSEREMAVGEGEVAGASTP
jgi:hypothetical protein